MNYEIPPEILVQCPPSVLVKDQKRTYGPVFYNEHGSKLKIFAKLRYDDQCGNGHNTFAVTANIMELRKNVWFEHSGGCLHEEVARHFPMLVPYIKWHLVSSDYPLHYIANTLWFVGDKDCWGLRKGEFRQFKSKVSGLPEWRLKKPEKILECIDAAIPPPPIVLEYEPWGQTGEGKMREFDRARTSAVWPEATHEQLSLPEEELAKLLIARLPALMWDFKKNMKELGFAY